MFNIDVSASAEIMVEFMEWCIQSNITMYTGLYDDSDIFNCRRTLNKGAAKKVFATYLADEGRMPHRSQFMSMNVREEDMILIKMKCTVAPR